MLGISIMASVTTLIETNHKPGFNAILVKTPIEMGQIIKPSDISTVKVNASNDSFYKQLANIGSLDHMVAKQSLVPGQIVQLSNLTNSVVNATGFQMAIALSSNQAPLKEIFIGDRIELIETVGTGSSTTSKVVATGVKVIGTIKPSGGIQGNGQNKEVLLLDLTNPLTPIAIAQSESAGALVAVKIDGNNNPVPLGTFSFSQLGTSTSSNSTIPTPLNKSTSN